MGACASKPKALREGGNAPVLQEDPAAMAPSETGNEEAKHKQKEKETVDAAAGEEGENNRRSLGVLMREVECKEEEPPKELLKQEQPAAAAATEDEKAVVEEIKEEEHALAMDLTEKAAVVVLEQPTAGEPETKTVVNETTITLTEQTEKGPSMEKVGAEVETLMADTPTVLVVKPDEREQLEDRVDSETDISETSATLVEQPQVGGLVEDVASGTGTAISESSIALEEQHQTEQPLEKVESETGTEISESSITLEEQHQTEQPLEKVESETGTEIFGTSISVEEQSETQQPLEEESESGSEISEASKIALKEQPKTVQPLEKVESETETVTGETSITLVQQPETEHPVEKVESETVTVIAETSIMLVQQALVDRPVEEEESETGTEISGTSIALEEQPESEQPMEKVKLSITAAEISEKQALIPEQEKVEESVGKLADEQHRVQPLEESVSSEEAEARLTDKKTATATVEIEGSQNSESKSVLSDE